MGGAEGEADFSDLVGVKNPRDTVIQISISIALGIGAFLAFCVCFCTDSIRTLTDYFEGSSPSMDKPLCCPKAAA